MIKLNIRAVRNTITTDLRRALKAAQNPGPALRAGGQVVVEHAKRAFREPELRPTAWQALAAKTIASKKRRGKSTAILIRDAHLIRTPRIVASEKRRVIVGSNLYYARFHQLGTQHVPARPFWPFHRNGVMTDKTQRIVRSVIARRLGITK